MAQHRYHSDLGELIETHRPAKAWIGWLISAGFGLPFGLLIGLGPPGPVAGLVFFLVIALSIFYGLGEWFFLEQRLYEHGLVLRSVPGLRIFVIPHYTIDPESLDVGGRRVHEGTLTGAIGTGLERRFRVTPFANATVRFVGLHPRRAHRLAKGRIDWYAATAGDNTSNPTPAMNWWWTSYQDPKQHLRLIAETIRRSQQIRPCQGQHD